jgi:hypothetical protein
MTNKYMQQSTKKLTKGGVLRKRDTSSLARSDHSCIRNALLHTVNGAWKLQRGCAYANGIFVVGEGLDFSKFGVIATGGRLYHEATCPLWKGFWLDGSLGVEPRSFGNALADGLCELGGGGGNHFGRRLPWLGNAGRAPFELYHGICLTTEESTENISQGSRVYPLLSKLGPATHLA